ncbi:MAG: putative zinc-binding metallopeptidase [Planctomycetota bacterium]
MGQPDWARASDDELLSLRFHELGLRIEGTPLEGRIERLYEELDRRGIRHKPRVWLSSEWFSPDGVPGIAIPFYLAHPRLMRLERRMMLEVEGGTDRDCMKILRHEAGHAISTAYRLHRRKAWREVFGRMSQPYPTSYRAEPFSKDYVLHLPWWYAQAHPAEDFAETFAVWLTPRPRWRRLYKDWPALKKLKFLDELIGSIAGEQPVNRSRRRIDPLSQQRSTLRQHYARKQRRYGRDLPELYDRDLKMLFPESGESSEAATRFLRRNQKRVREVVARWTTAHAYTIDIVLRDMIERARDLGLRHARPDEEALDDLQVLVSVLTMKYLQESRLYIAL